MVPVAPRPEGYNPLGVKNLDPRVDPAAGPDRARTATTRSCAGTSQALGASMNECMECWEAILPHTVRHPTLTVDLMGSWHYYQSRYPGAMYSGCGGGYLYVVSEEPVPGAFRVKVRIAEQRMRP